MIRLTYIITLGLLSTFTTTVPAAVQGPTASGPLTYSENFRSPNWWQSCGWFGCFRPAPTFSVIDCSKSATGTLVIPSTINGGAVTNICAYQPTSTFFLPGMTPVYDAFAGCTGLTRVFIPGTIESICSRAFEGCSGLNATYFLGDAPSLSETTFADTAPDFTIYYLSTSTGFTSPTWNGYPTVKIDVEQHSAAPWLLEHGLSHDTDLHQDLNHDGVSLLMAYALNLDPHEDLRSSLPVPVIDSDSLSLTFPATRVNLTYTVQTSTDLQTWTTEGVTSAELDASGLRTATVARDTPQRFLRLVVE